MEQGPAPAAVEPRMQAERAPSESFEPRGISASDCSVQRFTPQIQSALLLLLDAAACAKDVHADSLQFAVELSALRRLGLSSNECRWLVAKGLARHFCESTASDADRRTFQPCSNLSLTRRSCFVIADRGVAYASTILRAQPRKAPDAKWASANGAASLGTAASALAKSEAGDVVRPKPTWDSDRQQLRVGRTIVKEFKVPAANQEAILAAFQEDDWAPRIDDPLAPKLNQDPKRRLHDTINSLNRNQRNPLIHFLGDGKGEGIRWEYADPGELTD